MLWPLHRWLKTVEQTYLQAVDVDSNISWAAYHANQQPADDSPLSLTAMLPRFHEDSKSVAMIRHSISDNPEDWLEDSGWVEALVQAKVASAGIADSFLKASHVTRTRHAHQVTASSLYILLKKAYLDYTESLEPEGQQDAFDDWCERRQHEIPSQVPLLVYCSSAGALSFDICQGTSNRQLPSVCGQPYEACTMVLQLGPY